MLNFKTSSLTFPCQGIMSSLILDWTANSLIVKGKPWQLVSRLRTGCSESGLHRTLHYHCLQFWRIVRNILHKHWREREFGQKFVKLHFKDCKMRAHRSTCFYIMLFNFLRTKSLRLRVNRGNIYGIDCIIVKCLDVKLLSCVLLFGLVELLAI